MKKTGILNQPLSAVVAGLGHTDQLVVSDAGLPIPDGPQRIDLAVTGGLPPFLEVLQAILSEMAVERAIVAEEIRTRSPQMHAALLAALGAVPVEYVPHEQFKVQTRAARAIVRTGEFTPYANVILVAGVTF